MLQELEHPLYCLVIRRNPRHADGQEFIAVRNEPPYVQPTDFRMILSNDIVGLAISEFRLNLKPTTGIYLN